jgi:hypothetical protein
VKCFCFFLFIPNFMESKFVVIILSHRCNSPTDSGEAKVESRSSSETHTQPSHTASWHTAHLTRKPDAPMCQRKHRTTGRPCQRACAQPATGVARARWDIPGRPNPPLTRTALGQLCVASWVSRSWPAATQPSNQTRICSNAACTAFLKTAAPLGRPLKCVCY